METQTEKDLIAEGVERITQAAYFFHGADENGKKRFEGLVKYYFRKIKKNSI